MATPLAPSDVAVGAATLSITIPLEPAPLALATSGRLKPRVMAAGGQAALVTFRAIRQPMPFVQPAPTVALSPTLKKSQSVSEVVL